MLKKHRTKLIVAGVILLLLAGTFFLADGGSGRAPSPPQEPPAETEIGQSEESAEQISSPEEPNAEQPDAEPLEGPVRKPEEPENTDSEPLLEQPKNPMEQPEPEEPAEQLPSPEAPVEPETPPTPEPEPDPETFTVTLSVRCDTILQNRDKLKPEKLALLPEDGALFASREVVANRGESVFHLLQREMKRAKIHLEFENTPLYQSAYIEGIGNLYEYDCGEQSGWMYRVNGVFPGYGCSKYQLKAGDVVEWVYTCDLGRDVGGSWAAGGN